MTMATLFPIIIGVAIVAVVIIAHYREMHKKLKILTPAGGFAKGGVILDF